MSELTLFTSQQGPYSQVKVKNQPHSSAKAKRTLFTICLIHTWIYLIHKLDSPHSDMQLKCKYIINKNMYVYIGKRGFRV